MDMKKGSSGRNSKTRGIELVSKDVSKGVGHTLNREHSSQREELEQTRGHEIDRSNVGCSLPQVKNVLELCIYIHEQR